MHVTARHFMACVDHGSNRADAGGTPGRFTTVRWSPAAVVAQLVTSTGVCVPVDQRSLITTERPRGYGSCQVK